MEGHNIFMDWKTPIVKMAIVNSLQFDKQI